MVTIDGSQGEGGGQILRTSLALSLLTGQPVRITRIRAGRAKPGLLHQHLTSIQAAATVGQAEVHAAQLGSSELTFIPGAVAAGDYHFGVSTAGSATLVLQTVLPPLLRADGPSRLTLTGGTHNIHAPPFDFLAKTFVPTVARLGPKIEVQLVRPGFYPVGGGEFRASITPPSAWQPLQLCQRGPLRRRSARALVSRLPLDIARRELAELKRRLKWDPHELHVEEIRDAYGFGNVVIIELEFAHITEVLTAFGARGVRAERVAQDAAEQARWYLANDAPVGENLADQLLLPLALAGGGMFRTVGLSQHFTTNVAVIREFLPLRVETTQEPGGAWLVTVSAVPHRAGEGAVLPRP